MLAALIKAVQAKLAAAEDSRNALVIKSVEQSIKLTDEEVTAFNGFEKELADGTAELARLLK
jgi:hypothetical protein